MGGVLTIAVAVQCMRADVYVSSVQYQDWRTRTQKQEVNMGNYMSDTQMYVTLRLVVMLYLVPWSVLQSACSGRLMILCVMWCNLRQLKSLIADWIAANCCSSGVMTVGKQTLHLWPVTLLQKGGLRWGYVNFPSDLCGCYTCVSWMLHSIFQL